MDENNTSIFAQAKIEYTKQLIDVLKLPLYEGLQSIYSDSKQIYADNTDIEIDENFWDYSKTTGVYRNKFLNEDKKATEKKRSNNRVNILGRILI